MQPAAYSCANFTGKGDTYEHINNVFVENLNNILFENKDVTCYLVSLPFSCSNSRLHIKTLK